MIDFRYHLVSLISVFLALAVGIALGAGPLQESIGDTLTGQVDQLRAEKDTLRTDLDAANARLGSVSAYVEAAGPQLVAGTLDGRRVAVVALGELPQDQLDAVDAQLTAAGATVTAHATVNPSWTDPEQRSFRQAFAANLIDYLDPVPADSAGTDVDLAEALAQGLTGADPAAPDQLAEPASTLLQLLGSGDDPLVTFAADVAQAADAVVVIEPQQADEDAKPTAESDDADTIAAAQLAIVQAAQARSEAAVLAGGPTGTQSLIDTVLADEDLAGSITTVADLDQITGQVSVPLALNARIGGTTGHYGSGDDQTALPVPVALTPVDRTPVSTDPAGDDGTQDGGQPGDEATGSAG
ncbi:copper transporter [Cellulomonas hominis]